MYFVVDTKQIPVIFNIKKGYIVGINNMRYQYIFDIVRTHNIPHCLFTKAKYLMQDNVYIACLVIDDDHAPFARLCGLELIYDTIYLVDEFNVSCNRNIFLVA